MRILLFLMILCVFFSLSSKNEDITVFSKDKELFYVDQNFDHWFDKESVSIEIDSDTQKKYYYWHSVPDSINYVYIDSIKTIKVDSVVYVGSGEESGVFLIIKGKCIIFLQKKENNYEYTYYGWSLKEKTLICIFENDIPTI